MDRIKPQQYRLFINALQLMEAYIPLEPNEPDKEFLIFSSQGTGYMPKGCGVRCAFITKNDTDVVPALEIEKTLKMLRFSVERYLEVIAGMSPDPAVEAGQELLRFESTDKK